MNIRNLLFLLFFTVAGGLFACNISYSLIDSTGVEKEVSSYHNILLNKGDTYKLVVNYFQDHGRCDTEYSDTLFLVEEEKWKTTKNYLPLKLLAPIKWEVISKRRFRTIIEFEATTIGISEIEIIRECDTKEGYDEILIAETV